VLLNISEVMNMNFKDLSFIERVGVWFGPDPASSINESLRRYKDVSSGLHMTDLHGAQTEPGQPPVRVAISKNGSAIDWVLLSMVCHGVAYVEEIHADGWSYSRLADEAAEWRRSVLRGERESQRISTTPPA
jgi:hypothetical protein